MNELLAAAGAGCAALFAFEMLALLARPRSLATAAALIGPTALAGTRGRRATAADRLRVGALGVVSCSAVALVAAGPWLALAVALAGPLFPAGLLRLRRARWRSAMSRGAAAAARAVADASQAGLPGVAALERASGDGGVSPAVALELRDLATRCRLGLPLDQGLEDLRYRAGSPPWDALVAAVRVQRQVGGDLAAILNALAHGLEGSARARDEARSLSSQARLTARIVIAMPVGGLFLCEVASPGTVSGILASPLARLLAVVACALQAAAAVAVRRVARLGEKEG